MKVKRFRAWKRWFQPSDSSESFELEIHLLVSQEELEKVRARIFNLEKEGS